MTDDRLELELEDPRPVAEELPASVAAAIAELVAVHELAPGLDSTIAVHVAGDELELAADLIRTVLNMNRIAGVVAVPGIVDVIDLAGDRLPDGRYGLVRLDP